MTIKVKPVKWETHSADEWMNLILTGSFNSKEELEDHDCHASPEDGCDCQK